MPIIEERFQQSFKKQVAVCVIGKSQQVIALKYGLIASTPIDRFPTISTIKDYSRTQLKCIGKGKNVIPQQTM